MPTADLQERLEEALKDADLLVRGSMGQEVANPLIGEVRQHRTTINTLMADGSYLELTGLERMPGSIA